MTKNREKVIGALLTMDRPARADEIRQRAGFTESDLVTVYRNLDALETVKVMQRILLENGTQLFELTAPDEHFHHLVCRQCHHAERLDLCLEEQLAHEAKSRGYSSIAHVIEVYGICRECRKAED